MFFYIVLTPISTTSGLRSTGNTRKYQQIDVYIYQCESVALHSFHDEHMRARLGLQEEGYKEAGVS